MRAKIDLDNEASINLFKKKLNFVEESVCKPFQQITLLQRSTDVKCEKYNLISYEKFRNFC